MLRKILYTFVDKLKIGKKITSVLNIFSDLLVLMSLHVVISFLKSNRFNNMVSVNLLAVWINIKSIIQLQYFYINPRLTFTVLGQNATLQLTSSQMRTSQFISCVTGGSQFASSILSSTVIALTAKWAAISAPTSYNP